MTTVFAMKGNAGPIFHGAHSRSKLEIKGCFTAQGPQPVGDEGGVPQWIADAFAAMPHLQQLALNGEHSGVIYSRMNIEVQP